MKSLVKRYFTREGAHARRLVEVVKQHLDRQLMAPAPNRSFNIAYPVRDGREEDMKSCFVRTVERQVGGKDFTGLEVYHQEGGALIVTILVQPSTGDYAETVWS